MRNVPLRTAAISAAALLSFAVLPSSATPATAIAPKVAPPLGVATPLLQGKKTVETVEIPTRDKQTIHGTLTVPESRSKVPAALLIHGPGGDRASLDRIGERLVRQGFAVLALDLRGHGESRSDGFDWSSAEEEAARTSLWTLALKDVEAAADFVSADRRVHSTSLAVVGHEAGCALAARHAVRNENVRAIALIEPAQQTYGFDTGKDLEDLRGLPTMIVVGPEEREAGMSLARRTSNTAGDAGEFVELQVLRKPSVLEDKNVPSQVAKFLDDHAAPRRGR